MPKTAILRDIGLDDVLLPARLGAALQANDRAKYFLTLLQSARSHADDPSSPSDSLAVERAAGGVDAAELDTVVEAAVKQSGDTYLIPYAGELVRDVVEATRTMIGPLAGSDEREAFRGRLEHLATTLPPIEDDLIQGQLIDDLASTTAGNDSMHLNVVRWPEALLARVDAWASARTRSA